MKRKPYEANVKEAYESLYWMQQQKAYCAVVNDKYMYNFYKKECELLKKRIEYKQRKNRVS
jgi:hypothetical protein